MEKLRATLTEREGQEPVFQRIILYIDDLDRCPPHQVVKVLQAIHLLLTFPLFVVFVAVDVRWLRHALAEQYAGQVKSVEDSGGATASASDYLEKIFQIPYWVRPIDVHGTWAILRSRMLGSEAGEEEEPDSAASDPGIAPATIVEASEAYAVSSTPEGDDLSPTSPRPPEPSSPPPRPAIRSLRLTREERDFIRHSAALLDGSPRRTLRFLNTYRIIKGSLGLAEVSRLEEGGYRALLTMLSIAVSIDDCYPALLEALSYGSGSPLNILRLAFDQDAYGSADDRARVQRALDLFARQTSNDLDLAFYARLAARYSFNPAVGLLVAAPSDESAPDLAPG